MVETAADVSWRDRRKQCRMCEQFLPLDAFPVGSRRRKGKPTLCSDCRRLMQRARRAVDRGHAIPNPIPVEGLSSMLEAQGGVCAICEQAPGTTQFCLDHDHETGFVRGYLCDPCNRALGLFRDEPYILQAAIDYLEHSHQRQFVKHEPQPTWAERGYIVPDSLRVREDRRAAAQA